MITIPITYIKLYCILKTSRSNEDTYGRLLLYYIIGIYVIISNYHLFTIKFYMNKITFQFNHYTRIICDLYQRFSNFS